MATEPGWFGLWFSDGYFPSVWFAPGDDTHLTPDERRAEHVGGGFVAPPPTAPRRNQGKTRRDPKRDEALRIARRQRDEDILLLLI